MHQPDPGRLDELPGFLDLVLRDAGGIGRGRLVVPAQECQALPAIQPCDEPRRSATERSAAIEQQERPARRRNIPEPRALEYEAIHRSTHHTLGGVEPTILAPVLSLYRGASLDGSLRGEGAVGAGLGLFALTNLRLRRHARIWTNGDLSPAVIWSAFTRQAWAPPVVGARDPGGPLNRSARHVLGPVQALFSRLASSRPLPDSSAPATNTSVAR